MKRTEFQKGVRPYGDEIRKMLEDDKLSRKQ